MAPPDPVQMRTWFDSIDKDRNGVLSVPELQEALAGGGMPFSMSMVAGIVRQCDKDGSGTITFAEFEKLNALLSTVQSSFHAFDRDKDGRLSMQELATALAGMGYTLERQVLAAIFTRFDPLRQGSLGLQEFLALVLFLRNANATFRAFDPTSRGVISLNWGQFLYATVHTI